MPANLEPPPGAACPTQGHPDSGAALVPPSSPLPPPPSSSLGGGTGTPSSSPNYNWMAVASPHVKSQNSSCNEESPKFGELIHPWDGRRTSSSFWIKILTMFAIFIGLLVMYRGPRVGTLLFWHIISALFSMLFAVIGIFCNQQRKVQQVGCTTRRVLLQFYKKSVCVAGGGGSCTFV